MTLEELLVERACEKLILDFAASVDARDYARLRLLCVADLSLARPSDPAAVLTGVEAVIAAYTARPAERITQHLCTNIRITLASPGTARGSSHILLLSADGSAAFTPRRGRKAAGQFLGTYEDDFVLTAEGWRFQARRGRMIFNV